MFKLENYVKLAKRGDITGMMFMLPITSLSLVVRYSRLNFSTRCSLLKAAYSVLYWANQNRPPTGFAHGIAERSSKKKPVKQTLWTNGMIIRAMNLCVALRYGCMMWGKSPVQFSFGIGRIGTHPVECHFGMTRTMLRGETRYCRFFSTEINAILVQENMEELGLDPTYIRHYQNGSGCVVRNDGSATIRVNFNSVNDLLNNLWSRLLEQQRWPLHSNEYVEQGREFAGPFIELLEAFKTVGATDRIDGLTETAALGTRRIFMTKPEQPKMMEMSDD
jgi:hypothetical protein